MSRLLLVLWPVLSALALLSTPGVSTAQGLLFVPNLNEGVRTPEEDEIKSHILARRRDAIEDSVFRSRGEAPSLINFWSRRAFLTDARETADSIWQVRSAKNDTIAAQASRVILERADSARAAVLTAFPDDTTAARRAAERIIRTVLPDPAWRDGDLVGEMDASTSERFWGAAQKEILPAAKLALGGNDRAVYTELGHVLSGAFRFVIGSTLSIEKKEPPVEEETPPGTDEPQVGQQRAEEPPKTRKAVPGDAFERFMVGGGALSLQITRPVGLGTWGDYFRGALMASSRIMANIQDPFDAGRVDDYGWELALSGLVQRTSNSGNPFLTLELQAGYVGGSNAFWSTLGNEDASRMWYVAPSLHLSIIDKVSLGAATHFNTEFHSPGLRLNVSLSNRSRERDPAPAPPVPDLEEEGAGVVPDPVADQQDPVTNAEPEGETPDQAGLDNVAR